MTDRSVTKHLRLIALLLALALSGCGRLSESDAMKAVRKCADMDGEPIKQRGINGGYWVTCEDLQP